MNDKKGMYSGNFRLDPTDLEEPINDTDEELKKWLGGGRKIHIKRKIRRWTESISKTIEPQKLSIHMVGQSHIDIAWMWRQEQTRKKAQVTFKKALLHSDLFPDTFCYALSQPILLEWIKEDNSSMFAKIQEKVKTGNIELVGGSYLEPDCMMPSGEAMIRHRLFGMKFYFQNFGKLPKIEWFLDSFGYNYGLPQIIKKSGGEGLWTSKMTWNKDTTFPFVYFRWQGADGSRILTANFDYDPTVLERWSDYEIGRHFLKQQGKEVWNYQDDYNKLKNHIDENKICPEVGLFFGQSDGGHGPTHKEVAYANEKAKLSWFAWSRIHKFFDLVKKDEEKFPIWNDELYLENHRGCFSTHAPVKHFNRKFENAAISLEKLALLFYVLNQDFAYPKNKLRSLWKIILKNQFHDILPGSSIVEVYDDIWNDWQTQEKLVRKVKEDVSSFLSEKSNKSSNCPTISKEKSKLIVLFNPSSWKRDSRVFIPISVFENHESIMEGNKPKYARIELLNNTNYKEICQPIEADPDGIIDPNPSGWWTIMPLKSLTITLARITILNENEMKDLRIFTKEKSKFNSMNQLSNDFLSLVIDMETGGIKELISKKIDENKNLLRGNESNLTEIFVDEGKKERHAWDLPDQYWKNLIHYKNRKLISVKKIGEGPIFSTIQIIQEVGDNKINKTIQLFRDEPLVYFTYYSIWNDKDRLLKLKFVPNVKAKDVISDGMFCYISSLINPKTPADQARYEKICHKFIDLSTPDNEWGLALINEGKYAFDVREGNLNLTLLRTCKYPAPAPEAWVNQERLVNKTKFNHEIPEYSGLGSFSCRYALLPHLGGVHKNKNGTLNTIVKRKAEEFNTPILLIPLDNGINLDIKDFCDNTSLVSIEPQNVVISALKIEEWKGNNSIIIRFFETSGVKTECNARLNENFSKKVNNVERVDLLERKINSVKRAPNLHDGNLEFNINPYEILTFKLKLKD